MSEEIRHTKSLQHFMNQMTKECPQPECEAHLGRRRSEGLRLVRSPLSRPVEEVFFCVGPCNTIYVTAFVTFGAFWKF